MYVNVTRHPVLVYTDLNPLVFNERMKLKNQKILKWSLLIQSYNLEIKHIKGKNNVIADVLSRVGYDVSIKCIAILLLNNCSLLCCICIILLHNFEPFMY